MGGYHYWKGGDDDPRDHVGVNPTTPAAADAEPVHPVWGYPFPTTGPPDLQHAIQAATDAFDRELRERSLDAPDIIRIAVTAAAPVLLQATRDRLADLEGEYELTKARFNDFAEEAFERNRQHVVQVEELDRVVSLANAERNEARDRLADLQAFEQAIRDALWRCYNAPEGTQDATIQEVIDALAALDVPAAQEEGG